MSMTIPNMEPPPATISKITRGHSCVLCQQRKVKCDRARPCGNCAKARVECITVAPQASRRRRRRPPTSEENLIVRLKHYENLLAKHGIDIGNHADSVDNDDDAIDGPSGQTMDTLFMPEDKGSPALASKGRLINDHGQSRYVENNLYTGLSDELEDSKDTLSEEETIPLSLAPAVSGSNLLFGHCATGSLSSQHPQPVEIFRLWQTFLNNVNPLVKLLHAPTVQQTILEAASGVGNIPKSTEALMFAIYLLSVSSLQNEECESVMGESRAALLDKYSTATQNALINAGFLRTSNIVVLQAFTLYLLAMRPRYDPQTMWIMSGIAVRIGQAIGIHHETALRELSVFKAEVGRRLWWQIIILYSHSAQLAGVRIEEEAYLMQGTNRPANVNDSDLDPNMKEFPVEHTGVTEMLFCSVRYEMGNFLRTSKPLRSASLGEKDKSIDEFEARLQMKFLDHCDVSIPLHLLTSRLIASAVCQMRFRAHHPRQYAHAGASLPQAERDELFTICLEMIKNDNLGHETKSLQGFLWHVNIYFQLEAFIYILSELRHRTSGELVDFAWTQIYRVYEHHPELVLNTRNTIYFAIGNLTLKAWEAKANNQVPVPRFIDSLRSHRQPQLMLQHNRIANDEQRREDELGGASTFRQYESSSKQWADVQRECDDTFGLGTTQFLAESTTFVHANADDWAYWQSLLDCEGPDGHGV